MAVATTDGYGGGGDGYGYGYGDGGYGDGDGYGYGDGDGYGGGYGGGGLLTQMFADHPPVAQHTADGTTIEFGVWRSDDLGKPANGGTGAPVSAGLLQQMDGPLRICSRGFHATTNPADWKGDRWWLVALLGPVERDGAKMAALKRLIVAELA